MIALTFTTLALSILGSYACVTTNDCGVFEICQQGVCVPNNNGCPPCAPNQVCVAPNCITLPGPVATTTASPSTGSCPTGWAAFNGYCYFVASGRHTFNQASDSCATMRSAVVWFSSSNVMDFRNELNFVNTLAVTQSVKTYWIGLNKMFGQWVWSNAVSATFSNWRRSQPDKCCGGNVTCVLVNYANNNGQWDDAGCGNIWRNTQGFVCKRPM